MFGIFHICFRGDGRSLSWRTRGSPCTTGKQDLTPLRPFSFYAGPSLFNASSSLAAERRSALIRPLSSLLKPAESSPLSRLLSPMFFPFLQPVWPYLVQERTKFLRSFFSLDRPSPFACSGESTFIGKYPLLTNLFFCDWVYSSSSLSSYTDWLVRGGLSFPRVL